MIHYLVSWRNYNDEYRDLIVYAQSAAQARRLIKSAYIQAKSIKAIILEGSVK